MQSPKRGELIPGRLGFELWRPLCFGPPSPVLIPSNRAYTRKFACRGWEMMTRDWWWWWHIIMTSQLDWSKHSLLAGKWSAIWTWRGPQQCHCAPCTMILYTRSTDGWRWKGTKMTTGYFKASGRSHWRFSIWNSWWPSQIQYNLMSKIVPTLLADRRVGFDLNFKNEMYFWLFNWKTYPGDHACMISRACERSTYSSSCSTKPVGSRSSPAQSLERTETTLMVEHSVHVRSYMLSFTI
jgi:hypothetical protein